jgi:hypothetical protein
LVVQGAEQVNKVDWISMSEQVPPYDLPVLIRAHDGTITAARLVYYAGPGGGMLSWGGVGFDGYEWEWNWRDVGKHMGVTHWAYMPKGPDDEKEDQP